MNKDIQPQVNMNVTVKCACGNTFVTQSTSGDFMVEICSACHPFYTGQMKFVDTEGRIKKFEKKLQESQAKRQKFESKKKTKGKSKKGNTLSAQPSLKDLLKESKSNETK